MNRNINRHLIQQQKIELQLRSEGNAYALQEKMSRYFRTHLQDRLEQLFDELVDPDSLIQIDRLEVDLGHLSEDELFHLDTIHVWLKRIEEALQDYLTPEYQASQEAAPKAQFDQWLHFLKTGTLSWQRIQSEGAWEHNILETLATNQAAVQVLKATLRQSRAAFSRVILQHKPTFLAKMATCISAIRQDDLLEIGEEWKQLNLPQRQKNLTIQWVGVSTTRQQELRFWSLLLHKMVIQTRTAKPLALVAEVIREELDGKELTHLSQETHRFPNKYPQLVHLLAAQPDLIPVSVQSVAQTQEKEQQGSDTEKEEKIVQGLEQLGDPKQTSQLEKEEAAERKVQSKKAEKSEPHVLEQDRGSERKINPNKKSAPSLEKQGAETQEESEAEMHKDRKDLSKGNAFFPSERTSHQGTSSESLQSSTRLQWGDQGENREPEANQSWYLEHVGIVMIQPFLKPLFSQLGWVAEGGFVDDIAQHKAVVMLHYLASGETTPPEYNLVLPKVLCGLPLYTLIDRQTTLLAEELEEAEGLLELVINHWGVLGEVSTDSLREGFLQREGKLTKKGASWLLQVEQETLDLLLDQLPWGYNMIKLPWMPEMMTVEWR